jgi:hypothetical protein
MIEPLTIEIPAGVVATPTKRSRSANWAETNLVRWIDGKLAPIGGWSKVNYPAFASKIRAIHRWTTNNGTKLIGYLCEGHVYVDAGGTIYDVSPVDPLVAPDASFTAGGYGDSPFGFGSYGTPRPDKPSRFVVPDVFTIDNWGQNLLVMSSVDGRLLQWDPTSLTNKCEVVENAPLANRTFVVSPYRHVILFGMGGNPSDWGWCDEENIENWDFASLTSKAGKNNIQPASSVICAARSGSDVVLFTEDNVGHIVNYIGLPFIFSMDVLGAEGAPIASDALSDTPDGCIWASRDGFWRHSSGSVAPIVCPVWSWVNTLIDEDNARFTAAFAVMPEYSEVYFFFPQKGSATNTHYVVYNFKEGWWGTGKMRRSCGAKSTFTGYPILSDGVNVYRHEFGNAYALQIGEELPWAKTHNMNLLNGGMMMTVGRVLPDYDGDVSDVRFKLDYAVFRAGSTIPMNSGDKPVTEGIVGFMDTGRDFQMTVKQVANRVAAWTVGNNIVEVVRRGRL